LYKTGLSGAFKHAKQELLEAEQRTKDVKAGIQKLNNSTAKLELHGGSKELHSIVKRYNDTRAAEKTMKLAEEPVFTVPKARTVTSHQTPEQKTERYLKKGTMQNAMDFLETLSAPNSKSLFIHFKLQQLSPILVRELMDMMRKFQIPDDILLGIYYRMAQRHIGMSFNFSRAQHPMKKYARYIISHWGAAARTSYANVKHGGAANKQKHHRVLEFNLFCIGMIYYMADGGLMLEEKMEPRFPEALKHLESSELMKVTFKIQEIPSFPELNDVLLNRNFLHELSRCLSNFPVYQIGVEKTGQQLVQNCIRSRREAIRNKFYNAIALDPQNYLSHFKVYAIANVPLKPVE
jgi:hypothetical protein